VLGFVYHHFWVLNDYARVATPPPIIGVGDYLAFLQLGRRENALRPLCQFRPELWCDVILTPNWRTTVFLQMLDIRNVLILIKAAPLAKTNMARRKTKRLLCMRGSNFSNSRANPDKDFSKSLLVLTDCHVLASPAKTYIGP